MTGNWFLLNTPALCSSKRSTKFLPSQPNMGLPSSLHPRHERNVRIGISPAAATETRVLNFPNCRLSKPS